VKIAIPKIRKSYLAYIFIFVIVLGTLFSYALGYISHVSLKKIENGWICRGPFHFSKFLNYKNVYSRENKLFLIEKYERQFCLIGLKIVECKKRFMRDAYYVRAYNLSSGKTIYRRKIMFDIHPVQVFDIFPWLDNTVVFGYYQDKIGGPRKLIVTILNSKGKVQKQFPVSAKPLAVDEKNNLLICDGVSLVELPSGEPKINNEMAPISDVTDVVTDNEGNLYLVRVNKPGDSGNRDNILIINYIIEKYSILPRGIKWSSTLTTPSWPLFLDYKNNQLLVYYYDREYRDELSWTSEMFSADIGEKIKSEIVFNPYLKEIERDNRRYEITQSENQILVKSFLRKD